MSETFRQDITFKQGADWEETWAWVDEAGTLVNTSGYVVVIDIRDEPGSTLLLQASTTNGLVTVGKVNVPGATTAAVEDFGKGVWDMKITDLTGRIRYLVDGYVRYRPQVTI
jgi:hypothetical protein